jgi:hypothetical protein
MAYEIEHSFEDLPLITDHQGGYAGFVNGRAIISIGSGRDWSIDAIYLDGSPEDIQIDNLPGTSEGAIYNIVFSALTTGNREASIQELVNDWVDEHRSRRRVA